MDSVCTTVSKMTDASICLLRRGRKLFLSPKGGDRWGSAAVPLRGFSAAAASRLLWVERAARDPHPNPLPFRGRECGGRADVASYGPPPRRQKSNLGWAPARRS